MSGNVDLSRFLKSLKKELQPRARRAAKKAVKRFAEHVISEAQILCPVDIGNLKASGVALDPVDDGENIYCPAGFNMSYAAAVHERLDVAHPNGQAKFLETAMKANEKKFPDYVIDAVKKELGS